MDFWGPSSCLSFFLGQFHCDITSLWGFPSIVPHRQPPPDCLMRPLKIFWLSTPNTSTITIFLPPSPLHAFLPFADRGHADERSPPSMWPLVTLSLWCDVMLKEATGHWNTPQWKQWGVWVLKPLWSHNQWSTLSVIADVGLFWLTLWKSSGGCQGRGWRFRPIPTRL